eukprot:Nk52_evm32s1073 gene=Nk52_evmTU32s1073
MSGVGDKGEGSQIVVIGGGLAGLSAAIECHRKARESGESFHITLIEGQKNVGGNSAKATSGMNGSPSHLQELKGIQDSEELFREDTQRSGDNLNVPTLVRVLTSNSASAVKWVYDFGLDISDVRQLGGHSAARTHRQPPSDDGKIAPIGWNIIKTLKEKIESEIKNSENITILTESKVTQLLSRKDGEEIEVVGVRYVGLDEKEVEMKADAVILTTGGFGCDHTSSSLLAEFAPGKADLPTTNGPFAMGEGVKMGREIGANLIHMDKVQVHPTGLVDPANPGAKTKFLAPEVLRGCGGILLNQSGERFCNELGRRDYVTNKIFDNCSKHSEADITISYMVLNEEAALKFGKGTLGFYESKGFFKKFANAGELNSFLNAPQGSVASSFAAYADSSKAGKDEFGKITFPVTFTPDETLYVAVITPSIHYTMGGLEISGSAEVLHSVGDTKKPILRLFAAGEVTGGVHGENRLAGNSLLECVVFGRIAGERASKIHTKKTSLSKDKYTKLRFRERIDLTEFTKIFRFDLPSPLDTTGMEVGEYISVAFGLGTKDECIRYYSPVSRPGDRGLIDLLIKVDTTGVMSHYLNDLQPGDLLDFKGPLGGPKLPVGKYKKIGMIAGGCGISPMIQIIRSQLKVDSKTEMTLMYGAIKEDELVYKELLEEKDRLYTNLKIYFALNDPPEGWTQGVGFIDEKMIREVMHPPEPDTMIVICGPPAMCKIMKSYLENLGYSKDMYYSYM